MRLIDADALKEELLSWARVISDPRLMATDDAMCVIDHTPTVAASQWHRVEDKLPSMDGYDWVLGVVTGEAGYHRFHKAIMTVSFDPEYKEWFIDEYPDAKITVSHWMLLPEAPKEDV